MIDIRGTSPAPNPEHKLWLRQDRLILQAIQALVVGSIAPLISSCVTSVEAWFKLQTTLANRSHTRMLGLLSRLMNTKQEGSTITDYLQTIKLTDYETYLKREDKATSQPITAQLSQKFKRKRNQYRQSANKGPEQAPSYHNPSGNYGT
ncbi:hypothetical protein BHM03_00003276 [Ensete ventricosum]|nr:hypothetical protein BHM03_00003276 [Ensete ventricosum]